MRKSVILLALTTVFGLAAAVPAVAAPGVAPPGTAPLDHPVWVCLPGMAANPCNQNLAGDPQIATPGGGFTVGYPASPGRVTFDTTRVESGASVVEPFEPPAAPPVDCFFVYPTVDLLSNPTLQIGSLPPGPDDAAPAVTYAQVGPLLNHCRVFVPAYRQAPLAAHIVGVLTGTAPDYALGLEDVEQAWDTYWRDYNIDPVTHRRRGVVVIGHSQGAADAASLLRDRVDGHPDVQPSLVSALLLGGNVQVPTDRPAGGGSDPDAAFQHLPVCARASAAAPVPVGCVAGYSSYKQPAGTVPPPGSTFGLSSTPGHRILCTNPAALLTGAAPDATTPLDTRLPTRTLVQGNALLPNGHLTAVLLGTSLPVFPTGFARYPDEFTGACEFRTVPGGTASWLQLSGGDALVGPPSSGGLGLHVDDFSLTLGDLTALVDAQTAQWEAVSR
ncbi:DUF3089 domain-containing protein [Amycolatopsis sp. NPDC050768]|uniref:DUF3089 domain-containing protein n=1 Tax=Amycolatopsis sp. NPDC050768 TaxID=3154839 RepID=UPI0033FB11DA